MRENEFEKQIQQKMDELKLHPSDAVWQKIEPQIRKEKRRRWLLIFLPVLLICSLYGGYLILNRNDPGPQPIQQATKNTNEKTNAIKEPASIRDSLTVNYPLKENKEPITHKLKTIHNNSQKLKTKAKLKVTSDYNIATSSLKDMAHIRTTIDTTESKVEERSDTKIKNTDQETSNEETIPLSITLPENIIKQQNDLVKDSSEIKSITPAENATTNEIKKAENNKHPWNWGLKFTTGASGTANSLLENIFGEAQKSMDLQYNAGLGSSAAGPTPRASLIKPSLAFITGITVEKNLSKKTVFSTGLFYKRFSTTNKVGVDSAAFFRAFNYVNTYHNFYHYIELPVGLKFQLAGFKKAKLYLNTGFSISRLITAKALQYNNSTGLYYHDNSLFNKTQIGFNTALDIAFFSKQKSSILIGPYYNYGISKIAREGYNKHHFTFIGLRAHYLFGGNKFFMPRSYK